MALSFGISHDMTPAKRWVVLLAFIVLFVCITGTWMMEMSNPCDTFAVSSAPCASSFSTATSHAHVSPATLVVALGVDMQGMGFPRHSTHVATGLPPDATQQASSLSHPLRA